MPYYADNTYSTVLRLLHQRGICNSSCRAVTVLAATCVTVGLRARHQDKEHAQFKAYALVLHQEAYTVVKHQDAYTLVQHKAAYTLE